MMKELPTVALFVFRLEAIVCASALLLSNSKDRHGITRKDAWNRRRRTAYSLLAAAYAAALRASLLRWRNDRGAICARSLASKLADSLRLIITLPLACMTFGLIPCTALPSLIPLKNPHFYCRFPENMLQ